MKLTDPPRKIHAIFILAVLYLAITGLSITSYTVLRNPSASQFAATESANTKEKEAPITSKESDSAQQKIAPTKDGKTKIEASGRCSRDAKSKLGLKELALREKECANEKGTIEAKTPDGKKCIIDVKTGKGCDGDVPDETNVGAGNTPTAASINKTSDPSTSRLLNQSLLEPGDLGKNLKMNTGPIPVRTENQSAGNEPIKGSAVILPSTFEAYKLGDKEKILDVRATEPQQYSGAAGSFQKSTFFSETPIAEQENVVGKVATEQLRERFLDAIAKQNRVDGLSIDELYERQGYLEREHGTKYSWYSPERLLGASEEILLKRTVVDPQLKALQDGVNSRTDVADYVQNGIYRDNVLEKYVNGSAQEKNLVTRAISEYYGNDRGLADFNSTVEAVKTMGLRPGDDVPGMQAAFLQGKELAEQRIGEFSGALPKSQETTDAINAASGHVNPFLRGLYATSDYLSDLGKMYAQGGPTGPTLFSGLSVPNILGHGVLDPALNAFGNADPRTQLDSLFKPEGVNTVGRFIDGGMTAANAFLIGAPFARIAGDGFASLARPIGIDVATVFRNEGFASILEGTGAAARAPGFSDDVLPLRNTSGVYEASGAPLLDFTYNTQRGAWELGGAGSGERALIPIGSGVSPSADLAGTSLVPARNTALPEGWQVFSNPNPITGAVPFRNFFAADDAPIGFSGFRTTEPVSGNLPVRVVDDNFLFPTETIPPPNSSLADVPAFLNPNDGPPIDFSRFTPCTSERARYIAAPCPLLDTPITTLQTKQVEPPFGTPIAPNRVLPGISASLPSDEYFKPLSIHSLSRTRYPSGGLEEFEAMQNLYNADPTRVVRPIEPVYEGNSLVGYRMERAPGEPLYYYEDRNGYIPAWVHRELKTAVKNFADRGLAHGDLNPMNILINETDQTIKIIDPLVDSRDVSLFLKKDQDDLARYANAVEPVNVPDVVGPPPIAPETTSSFRSLKDYQTGTVNGLNVFEGEIAIADSRGTNPGDPPNIHVIPVKLYSASDIMSPLDEYAPQRNLAAYSPINNTPFADAAFEAIGRLTNRSVGIGRYDTPAEGGLSAQTFEQRLSAIVDMYNDVNAGRETPLPLHVVQAHGGTFLEQHSLFPPNHDSFNTSTFLNDIRSGYPADAGNIPVLLTSCNTACDSIASDGVALIYAKGLVGLKGDFNLESSGYSWAGSPIGERPPQSFPAYVADALRREYTQFQRDFAGFTTWLSQGTTNFWGSIFR